MTFPDSTSRPIPGAISGAISRRAVLAGAAGAAAAVALPGARAQSAWPSKPIRFLVPFAPGGTSEIVARSVAAELTKQLGQTVFVENKPGGAGVTAMQEAKNAAPDGHTIILTHVGTMAVNPYMLNNQPYDVNKDFAPVTLLAKVPNVFVIHPDVPARNFKEFVAYAKANPGRLNYGSAGNASAGHLAMEYLKLVTGMFITHIPYRGTGPQLTDLLAGRTQASSAGMPALGAHIRSGKLRAIAVGTQQRIAAMPDVPTVEEMGFKGFETSQWYGMHVPAGTPPEVIRKLEAAMKASAATNEVKERLVNAGGEEAYLGQADFVAFIKADAARWEKVVKIIKK